MASEAPRENDNSGGSDHFPVSDSYNKTPKVPTMASKTDERESVPQPMMETAEERKRALVAQFGTAPREMTAAFSDGRTTMLVHYANPLDVPSRIKTDMRTFFLIEAKPDRRAIRDSREFVKPEDQQVFNTLLSVGPVMSRDYALWQIDKITGNRAQSEVHLSRLESLGKWTQDPEGYWRLADPPGTQDPRLIMELGKVTEPQRFNYFERCAADILGNSVAAGPAINRLVCDGKTIGPGKGLWRSREQIPPH